MVNQILKGKQRSLPETFGRVLKIHDTQDECNRLGLDTDLKLYQIQSHLCIMATYNLYL